MPGEVEVQVQGESLLREAQQALEAGRWSDAKEAFAAALEEGDSPEALFGLGNALWWLGETEASARHQERAYAAFRRRPDQEQAALTAIYLCFTYNASFGNNAAARGWLGRASALIAEHDLVPLEGWTKLCGAAIAHDDGDPREAEMLAHAAWEAARRTKDRDLELCALGARGASLVALGRVEEGVLLLDEAMAGALGGEGESLDTVVQAACMTVTSCSRAAELKRAAQWIRAADAFTERYGSPHLYTKCRTAYGGVLLATGKWAEAERELEAAVKAGREGEPGVCSEALAKLAELRLAQGRVEEAGRLLEGFEDHGVTACTRAAIRLARGEPEVAASIVRARLREVGESSLEGAVASELLAEAELERSAADDELIAGARRLVELGVSGGCELIRARGERMLGRCLAAGEDPAAAIPHLEAALTSFGRLEMPLETARTRLLLAIVRLAEERDAAIAMARDALSGFEQLGADAGADATAAFLRSLGERAARRPMMGLEVLTKREREVLALLGEGLSNPEIATRLFITRKTVEHHVASVLSKLDLRGRAEAAAYAVRNPTQESTGK